MSEGKPGTSRGEGDQRSSDLSNLPRGAIGIGGLPVARNARLPSIRSPRDYSLSAAPKRTFVPNIPVRRGKQTLSTDEKDQKSDDTDGKDRKNDNTKSPNAKGQGGLSSGRGRGQRSFVQLPGSVFGGGGKSAKHLKAVVKADEKKQKSDSLPSASKSPEKQKDPAKEQTLVVPKAEAKSDTDSSDSFIDNESDSNDDSESDDGSDYYEPIHLPLRKSEKESMEAESKESAITEDSSIDSKNHLKQLLHKEPSNIKELLFENFSGEDQFIFFELPGTILFPLSSRQQNRDLRNDVSMMRSYENSSSGEQASGAGQDVSSPKWSSCPEGYIGKLQLLKSGKSRLVIGNYILDDIEMLEPSPMFQQLASVQKNAAEFDMTMLHPLTHRVRMMSDIECLRDRVV